MKMKLKKGDTVLVVSGKDKGKQGTILHSFPMEGKVVVDGVGLAKRHSKGARGQVGTIVEHPRKIDASNVMLFVGGKPTRVKREMRDGKSVRVAVKGGSVLS